MGADFNFQVPPMGSHPSQPSLKREGVNFPPCEGGLKVGANFNYQVSPMGCHPSQPSLGFIPQSLVCFRRQQLRLLVCNPLFLPDYIIHKQ